MKVNLAEVLKEVEDNKFFKVLENKDFIKVSYRYNAPPVFDTPLKRELRGITFNKETGEIVSRPYHKFFNLGEAEETEEEKLKNRTFIAREKLDGTMLHPVLVNGEVKLLTQKAFSNPQTEKGEELLSKNPKLYRAVKELLSKGYTPIFELISPQFQLVIPYEREELILTELKEMGFKLPQKQVGTLDDLKKEVEKAEKIEGFVLKDLSQEEPFPLFVKLKSPWYHKHHYAFTYLHNIPDHKLFNLFLQGKADDLFSSVLNRELREEKRERLDRLVYLYRDLLNLSQELSRSYGKPEFETELKRKSSEIQKKHGENFSRLDLREDYLREAVRLAKKRKKFDSYLGTKLYTMLKAGELKLKS